MKTIISELSNSVNDDYYDLHNNWRKLIEDIFNDEIFWFDKLLDSNLPVWVLGIKNDIFNKHDFLLGAHYDCLDNLGIDYKTPNSSQQVIIKRLEENYLTELFNEIDLFKERLIRITNEKWK